MGTRPLSQSVLHVRVIYYFSFAVLFSSAPWLESCLSVRLLGEMTGESSHQHTGEVKPQIDGAFPGDLATWLMALLRACPGIACRYNSLPLFPLASSHLEPIHELRWCVPFPRGHCLSLHNSYSQSSPPHPLRSSLLLLHWASVRCDMTYNAVPHCETTFSLQYELCFDESAAVGWWGQSSALLQHVECTHM